MDKEEVGTRVIMGHTEIDTRAPFKSVKEAVVLFGERVLVGEIYASTVKEMRDEGRGGTLAAELEETKQRLEGAREKANTMAQCIKSLEKELEETKKELEDTKAREKLLLQRREDPEAEDLKYMANANNVEIKTQSDDDDEGMADFQKRRYVKFASPPHVLGQVREELVERTASASVKRKPPVPLIGWLFSKKKGSNIEVASPKA